MKFRGTHPTLPIKFSFGKTDYSVEPGETVEIEDKWVSRVYSRGLLLEEVKDAEPVIISEPSSPPESTPPAAEVVTPPKRGPGRPPKNASTD